MHKKFEINGTRIKGGCQSGRRVVTHNSKSDLPLGRYLVYDLLKSGMHISGLTVTLQPLRYVSLTSFS